MKEDAWHYPRENLAARTLNALVEGSAKALTLFAPRRTGKTEFLTKDLTPYAESKGHKVVYISFWRAPLSPLALILYSLEVTLKSKTLTRRTGSVASILKPKLKLSAPIGGARAEAEIDLSSMRGEPPAQLILFRKIQSIIVIKVVRSPVIQAYPEKIEFYARIDEERQRGELTRMLPGEASRALAQLPDWSTREE